MWAPDPACSGHGMRVNLTGVLTGFEPDALVGCVCDAGWDAGADLFDLRLGSGLAMDCIIPNAAVIVFWAILLLLTVARMRSLLLLMFQEHEKLGLRCAASSPNSGRPRRRISGRAAMIALDFFVATPLMIATSCLKLVDGQKNVLGTDLPTTLTLLLGVLLQVQIWAEFEIVQFKVVVTASLMGRHKAARRLTMIHSFFSRGTAWAYFGLTIVPTIVALGLDHDYGPIASGEYLIVIIRNIGVMIWMALSVTAQLIMRSQIRRALDLVTSATTALSHANRENEDNANTTTPPPVTTPPPPASPSTAAEGAKRMVAFFERMVISHYRKATLVLIFYTIFTIPWVWPYQTFNMSFSAWLLQLDMNPARVTLKARSAAKKETKNSSFPFSSSFRGGKKVEEGLDGHQLTTFSSFSPRAMFQRHISSLYSIGGHQTTGKG